MTKNIIIMMMHNVKRTITYDNIKKAIRPSYDLRNHYNEISQTCKENGEAVIVTVNGRGDTVTMGYEDSQQLKTRFELLEMLAEAEDDVRTGRVGEVSDMFKDVRKRLLV